MTTENPPSSRTFDALPLSSDLRRAIDALGYVEPTPVQLAVFEPAAEGKSIVVQARTGTGKTAAFGMPLIDRVIDRGLLRAQALVLTPTRELALQVTRELEKLAQFRGTKLACIYGGAGMGKQIDALQAGAQIVVGTPGRVLDHIRRGTFDTSRVRVLVLDEADEMLSMGFAKELSAIADALPPERQGMFFSATLPPDIQRLAENKLREPEFITLSGDAVGALEVQHFVYVVPAGDKRRALLSVLEVEDPESAIVFCNTKEETERLAEMLKSRGYDAEWLNGDLEQSERERVMQRTREGKCRFLVATDVAARGIDISHLTHVINADFPESAEQYVHRTGRTGRAGRTGTAISVIGPKDVGNLYLLRLTYKIRPIEKQLPSATEVRTREEADLVNMFADAYAERSVHPDDLALARRLLTHAAGENIVAGLLRDHLGARTDDPRAAAAEARRAKNPPPVAAPPVISPAPGESPASFTPSTRREVPADGRERARRAPRPAQKEAEPRRGRKHATYTDWEPPAEPDDDRPILERSRAHEDMPLPGFSEAPHDADAEPITLKKGTEGASRREGRGDGRRERDGRGQRDAEGRGGRDEGRGEREREEEAGFARIFLNVGRRDGARAEDLQRMLTEAAGIGRPDTGRIRVRDRVSFVSVRTADMPKAIAALAGKTIGGRTVVAEPAKAKQDGEAKGQPKGQPKDL